MCSFWRLLRAHRPLEPLVFRKFSVVSLKFNRSLSRTMSTCWSSQAASRSIRNSDMLAVLHFSHVPQASLPRLGSTAAKA
jgi:hypothetical protein